MLCDVTRVPLYAQVDQIDKDWLDATCREAGMSMAAGLRAILAEARQAGVSLQIMGRVIRP